MAELLLIVHPSSSYEEGDVLCAFNQRRIRSVHAQHICNPRQAIRNRDGLLQVDSMPQQWYENTHQFRFNRVSTHSITRTNLVTGEVDVISNIPNEKGEAIDVELFLSRRKQHPANRIFGSEGAEFWYGGNIDESHINLDKVWQKIEERTPHREVNFKKWPLTDHEKRIFLGISTDDFNDTKSSELTSSEVDDSGELRRKRIHRVNFRAILAASQIADVLDRAKSVDIRDESPRNLNAIVLAKPIRAR